MATDQSAGQTAGVIENLGVLDLTGMKAPEDLAGITLIRQVGVILVPEALSPKLASIPMRNVGVTVPIPEGARLLVGPIKLTGEALAAPAGGQDALVVVGPLLITTPVEKVGYGKLVVVGPVVAPRGSETALAAGISRLTGPLAYYTGNARLFVGNDRFGRSFLDLVEGPLTMVLVGDFVFEPDVPADLLKQKVSGITLLGKIAAPKELMPLLQALTVEKLGEITLLEEATERQPG